MPNRLNFAAGGAAAVVLATAAGAEEFAEGLAKKNWPIGSHLFFFSIPFRLNYMKASVPTEPGSSFWRIFNKLSPSASMMNGILY